MPLCDFWGANIGNQILSHLSRRQIIAGLGASVALPALVGRAQAQGMPASFAGRGDIVRGLDATVTSIQTQQPLVALTFDDGPHPRHTPALLDYLAALNVRATFYMIGRNVVRYPQLAARVAAEGHEIGNHTYNHPVLSNLSDASAMNEIDRTTLAIQDAVGRPPVTMRPPYGQFTERQRLMLHQARNMPTVLWSVDPEDWRRPSSPVITQRILDHSRPGSVILAHDIHLQTVRAVPATVQGLAARGYGFVTVSELIGWPRWDSLRIRVAARTAQG